jgi:uncharacterized membrane protein
MARKKRRAEKNNSDSKLFAFIAAFLSIVGFIIALLVKRDDKYVMYYAKQSLIVFIVFVVAWIVLIVPIIGWVVGILVEILGIALWILSWGFALTGKMRPVPLFGKYAEKINL